MYVLSTELVELAQSVGIVFGPSGAAWIGVKLSLNGTRKKVDEIHADMKEMRKDVTDTQTRVTVLEVHQGIERRTGSAERRESPA